MYPNGKIEIAQSFKKGKLNGIRKIYYPNGGLYVAEKFKNGERVDYRNIYLPSGQLCHQSIYKNGFISQVVDYQDTAGSAWYINFKIHHINDLLFGDERRQPQIFVNMPDSLRRLKNWDKRISNRMIFEPDGRSYTTENYDYKGSVRAKGYVDFKKRIRGFWMYYENENLESYSKLDQLNDRQQEFDYNPKGIRRDFDKKCTDCKLLFDTVKPPGATPEPIYFE